MPRGRDRGCWPGVDAGWYPASTNVGGFGDSVSLCLPRGAGPGLGGGGSAGSRERLWRGLKGPSGPTRLDAEIPWNNCDQRSGGPETGPGVKVPGWGVLEDAVSCEAGGFIGLPQKGTSLSPPCVGLYEGLALALGVEGPDLPLVGEERQAALATPAGGLSRWRDCWADGGGAVSGRRGGGARHPSRLRGRGLARGGAGGSFQLSGWGAGGGGGGGA